MLKEAFEQGYKGAFDKFALSLGLKQKAMGAALGRQGLQAGTMPINSETLHIARTGRMVPGSASENLARDISGISNLRPAFPPEATQTMGATAAPGVMNAVKRFGSGQMAHAQNLWSGIRNIGSEAGRGMAWQAAKGLAPTLGGAAALGLGAYAMSGPSEEQKRQQAMQQMLLAHGGM